ncbi:MAG TPA: CocE/NonD family hydrolase [Solirubrobacterales bacterium]|nr:CocE/NonD family hydrolase [Solirubrobacterales bacterium]
MEGRMRKLVLLSVVVGSLLLAPGAQAAITDAFGGALTCTEAGDGVRECGVVSSDGGAGVRSTAPSWDDTPIDVKVAFPPDPSPSPDGNYPLIIWGHGYGGSKNDLSFSAMRHYTDRGYAVFAMTARGFHQSCGKPNAITAAAGACDDAGWIHLMDDRFEVRDAQFFAGELADEELVDGQRVGATGGSYGGGLSLQLATLKDRVMMPDGSVVPWTSPVDHHPMRIAGATPNIPWSDLAYSLTPNGGKLDYVADAAYTGRIGIQKQSFVQGLYLSGQGAGSYCGQSPYPACTDFQSDITAWNNRLNEGEPYDGDPMTTAVFNEIEAHHSAYYIDHSTPPAPLLISNGFTDDLFPADEAIAYYNRIRSEYPNGPISMLFGDFGHMRAANKSADVTALGDAQDAWLDFYIKGSGSQPFQGVTSFAMTCPDSQPSGGPFQAGSWAGLQKGEVRLDSAGAQVLQPGGGSADVDEAFDPVSAGGNPCTTASSADLPGVATYRLPAATGSGFTLMGSPTVVAKISSPTANSEVAARLLDVDPSGTETLVDRQLYRPQVGTARQVFQLHPTGHLFAPGHVAKLELLPSDSHGALLGGYGRAANGQGPVTISNLSLRLPTLDGPGAAGGQARPASALPLPCGAEIAQQYSSSEYVRATLGEGKLKRKGKSVMVPVDSAPSGEVCRVQVRLLGKKPKKGKRSAISAKKKGKKKRILGTGKATIAGGQSKVVKVKLSKRGRATLRKGGRIRVQVTTVDAAGNTLQLTNAKVMAGQKKRKR